MSLKQRRRKCKSKQFRANLNAADAAFLSHHSYGNGLSASPSSESQFSDTSSASSISNRAGKPDEMDID